jgi:hypothetical protein
MMLLKNSFMGLGSLNRGTQNPWVTIGDRL